MKTVTLYTDGACSGNPGPGGWGAILEYMGHEKEMSGGEMNTTNNRMELTAVILGTSGAERALHRSAVFGLQVRHRRAGKGLGMGLEETKLGQVRQKARFKPRPLGSAAGADSKARAALPLGQGPRRESQKQPLRPAGRGRVDETEIVMCRGGS